ncbi:MAG: trypsin-like peptidase domain-containing protein [bacterium]|nr:trypsin-like peptidase domain-containing protein [bacterium]
MEDAPKITPESNKENTVKPDSNRFNDIKPVKMEVKQARRARNATTGLMIFVAAAAGFGGGLLGSRTQSISGSDINNIETRQQIVSSEGELISEITKKVSPSVVSVSVTAQDVGQGIFGQQQFEREGAGTGVIISDDGVIITNRHVVPRATTKVSVTLSDGTILDDVEVIGRTSDSDPLDIAFLKIKDSKGKDLKKASIGDSAAMEVGDRVIAIGNALGQFENTVTSGILSGYGRDIEASSGSGFNTESLTNLFQTDAAINPGNSGGPLMNLSGEVIGINVAVADAQNIGFAIPINDIKGLIASVQKNGKLERPYLGVRYISLTDDSAYFYNLDTKRGAYVAPSQNDQSSVIADSPAAKAGLQEKDIITKINDVSIDEKNSLISVLGRFAVDDTVELTVIRDGKELRIKIKLEASRQ